MPVHPTPPTDLVGLVTAWSTSVAGLIALGRECTEADFARPTCCPGWTVQDQLAHVAGVEAMFGGAAPSDVAVPDYPWIRHDMGRFMEGPVQARRSWPGSAVVDELAAALTERQAAYADPALTVDSTLATPLGEMTLGDLVTLRIMDVWVHEQDVREALGRPGGLESGGASVFVQAMLDRVPRLWAPLLAADQGLLLRVEGPTSGVAGVGLLGLPEGDGTAQALFDDPGQWPGTLTMITGTTQPLTRRAAGRVPTAGVLADASVTIDGDAGLGTRALEALAFVP
ncbi:MAG: maleylpyruvate isomerase family mycothiol-dependent enzyme [Dermatophilaceae bacterium]